MITKSFWVVPKVDLHYIKGNSLFRSYSDAEESSMERIMGEFEDEWSFEISFEQGIKYTHYGVDSVLSSKEVNGVMYDDVILIRKTVKVDYYGTSGGAPMDIYYYYYAKNIGLILYRSFIYYGEDVPPTEVYGLSDYYIAPH